MNEHQTGLTWHRGNELVSGLHVCEVGGDFNGWGAHADPFCCADQATDPSGGKCNWLGAQKLCTDLGMRLATEQELIDLEGTSQYYGGCVSSWETWSATRSPSGGAYYMHSNMSAPFDYDTTTPYGVFSVRCVK